MKKQAKKISRLFLNIFLIILTLIILTLTILGIVFAIYIEKNIEKEVDESLFTFVASGSSTELYYYEYDSPTSRENREGNAIKLSSELYGGYRCVYADYNDIPKDLINAFVSIEDKRFWQHKGVDAFRTMTAGLNYFLKFNDSFGGSTITQQLIKNVTEKDDYSIQRKLQEIFWALDLEKKMSKEEIIGLYLNIINLSQGCYGVRTAAEYYFSKELSELTLAECATIAAITNSPSYYDPLINPENNLKRRNLILSQMLEQEYITETQYNEAISEEIRLNISSEFATNKVNSWYIDMVIDDILNDLIEQKGYSRSMANLILYTGGLKIYTAMDLDIQNTLEDYYSVNKNFYDVSQTTTETPESSMIVIDPLTGDILGVVGAVGKKTGNRIQNYATQTKRPPGSVLKPLAVYAPALEDGLITWSTVYDDTPFNFGNYNLDAEKGKIVEPNPWPKNASGTYRGLTNINYAIAHSVNTVSVKVLEDLGKERSFDFLYNDLEIKSLVRSKTLDDGTTITDCDYAALALGQTNYGTTVREITAAYSIFANNGIYNKTRSYYKVTDINDNTLLENKYSGHIVLSEENASIMTLMLQNVISYGTAKDVSIDSKIDCAGKTGTTQFNHDKWFVGYTPYFIGGVWYGYEYPKAINDTSGNKSVEIWDDIMTLLHEKYVFNSEKIMGFDISEGIEKYEFCTDSGKIFSQGCKYDPRGERIETGYFEKGTQPKDYCDTHVIVDYDIENGGIAFSGCGIDQTKKVSLISVKRSFPKQIFITDAQYTWQDIGTDILPELSEKLPFYNNLLVENEYSGISNTEQQFNRYCKTHFNYFEWNSEREKQKKK